MPARTRFTLHEAMRVVLSTCPDQTADYALLADEINRRRLYRRKDGQPLKPGQIRARARQSRYAPLFERIPKEPVSRTPARIRLIVLNDGNDEPGD